jgi:hypothetical protein
MKIYRGIESEGCQGDNGGCPDLEYWTPDKNLAELYANPPVVMSGLPKYKTGGHVLVKTINLKTIRALKMDCFDSEKIKSIPTGYDVVLGMDEFTGRISEIIFRK